MLPSPAMFVRNRRVKLIIIILCSPNRWRADDHEVRHVDDCCGLLSRSANNNIILCGIIIRLKYIILYWYDFDYIIMSTAEKSGKNNRFEISARQLHGRYCNDVWQ